MKNKIKLFSILIVLLISLFCFSGCQSTDKSNSFFNYSSFEQATFEYDEETNKTKVIFYATLTNETIYNFNSFSIKLKLYSHSNYVSTETYNYTRGVKNGDSYAGFFNFYENYIGREFYLPAYICKIKINSFLRELQNSSEDVHKSDIHPVLLYQQRYDRSFCIPKP